VEKSIKIGNTDVTVTEVIRDLAEGKVHDQILIRHPELSLRDILGCLKLAADMIEHFVTAEGMIRLDGEFRVVAYAGKVVSLDEIREKHPRAYAKWQPQEDNHLAALYKSGKTVKEIAVVLKRQTGAVWARLQRLELIK